MTIGNKCFYDMIRVKCVVMCDPHGFIPVYKYFYDDQIKGNNLDVTCSMHVRNEI